VAGAEAEHGALRDAPWQALRCRARVRGLSLRRSSGKCKLEGRSPARLHRSRPRTPRLADRCPIVGDPLNKTSDQADPNAPLNTVSAGEGQIDESSPGQKQQPHLLPFLHSRSIVIRYVRSDTEPLSVSAPLPRHMAQFWSRQGWDHAITSFKRPSRPVARGEGERPAAA